jgi:uncharacterized membrane protein YbhN (UPF0104 family)
VAKNDPPIAPARAVGRARATIGNMKQRLPAWLKTGLVLGILALTTGLFIYFFATHPEIVRSLSHLNPWLLVALLLLYGVSIFILVIVYHFTLLICGHRMGWRENLLLTSYSSIANFFGPLQSGPGVRAVYLKKRHNVALRDYTLASLVYYAFFAIFSAGFLLVGSTAWWLAALGMCGMMAGCFVVIRWSLQRARRRQQAPRLDFSTYNVVMLGLATLAQLVLVALIYWIELHAVNSHASVRQAVTYTGAANFALFVSLTPGAIGFRESFLLFSQHLHHLSTASVLGASLIDRAVYVVFLGLLFAGVLAVHGSRKLRLKGLRPPDEPATSQ